MSAAPAFHHADAGTPESAWLGSRAWRERPVVDLEALAGRHARVLVAAAHPDDETLGVGALMADLDRLGCALVVMVASAGERSHPASPTFSRELLAATRRAEARRAIGRLAPTAKVVQLDVPDGDLPSHEERLVTEVESVLTADTLVLAPWVEDGHSDHDALGRAAATAAERVGATIAHYPVWLWHWAEPAALDWGSVHVVEPSPHALRRKHAAVDAYRSQVAPLSPLRGDEPVLTPPVLDRTRRVVETLISPEGGRGLPVVDSASGAAAFDAMYAAGPDPWGFHGSFYEARKRDLTLAALGRPRYGSAIEIGCATGVLTRTLAERSEQVTGVDVSARALEIAAEGAPGHTTWLHAQVPDGLPGGEFDLVVLSEIGYFLSGAALLATFGWARSALREGGEILLAHWQHETTGVPLDGALVHEQAATFFDLPRRAAYRDEDVAIDVFGEPASIALLEGRR